MIDQNRPSASKRADEARETVLNLSNLLGESLQHLDKLVAAKSAGGKKRGAFKRKKKLVR